MKNNYYPTFELASEAFNEIIKDENPKGSFGTSYYFYQEYYYKDPKLPPSPEYTYRKTWKEKGGWRVFLKKEDKKNKIYSFEEAQKAIQKLRPIPKKTIEYYKYYRQDKRLVYNPKVFYPDFEKRGSWDAYLLLAEIYYKKNPKYYDSVLKAKRAIIKLGIKNIDQYKDAYWFDSKLPPDLHKYYGKYNIRKVFGSCNNFT